MQQVLKLSLVVPVYQNEGSINELIEAVRGINECVRGGFEVIFVVDGSPDGSYSMLRAQLPAAEFQSQLISLSRNFGAFHAIRVGLEKARGQTIAVMAADLQEPPDLVMRFQEAMAGGQYDVAFGVRESRADPMLGRMSSDLFWFLYRRFVIREIPSGGVDVFAVTSQFRDRLISLQESNSSLLAQMFWLGGRRVFVGYVRLARRHGRSSWTLRKKFRYLSDSVFAFTDLPVRLLFALGVIAMLVAAALAMVTLVARFTGAIAVPGYTGTMLTIIFFGGLNSLGLGVVGTYAWRAFENTKRRPLALIQSCEVFEAKTQ